MTTASLSSAGAANRGFTWKFARLNWAIITVLAALAAIGVIMHFSVADGSWAGMPLQHALRFGLMLAMAVALAIFVEPRWWLSIGYPLYGVALALLVAVEFFGETRDMGARRWLDLGFTSFQPSEVMKIGIVLALARYYNNLDPRYADSVWSIIPPLILIAVPTALVMHQPDLGTALLIAGSGIGVMFLAGLKWLYILPGMVASIGAGIYAYFFILHDYQRDRINTFLDPTADPLGTGYHVLQSKIAVGAAGVFGHGYLQGPQSQNDFLPEKHTDFIFTMIVEEFGLVGAAIVLGLFAGLIGLTLTTAMRARTLFGRLAAGGMAITTALYALINTSMVIGLIPVVGIPLPLLSFGGTAMLTLMIGYGMVLAIHLHRDGSVGARGVLW